ncbi:MAG: alpha/beta hydrolase, partial [Pirellulaceae bacterium]|jgi:acetyl esterase|nr:alpha/beta hydrolase [Pirellulaceae bacterium]
MRCARQVCQTAVGMAFFLVAFTVCGQQASQPKASKSYPPTLPGAQVEVYKTIGDVQLKAYIYYPRDHQAGDRRAAAIFYFGGGWRSGTPSQFMYHCKHLASRGMVAITVDYRVSSRHQTKAVSCVGDAKSAVRWVREHQRRLGVDPRRILAGGGSAGGHLAACTAVVQKFDEATEDRRIPSRPNALALFNPALVLAPVQGVDPLDAERMAGLADRMGVSPVELSPLHHVRRGLPPTIIFHGQADTTVPFETARQYANKARQLGNQCKLVGYPGQSHGFFNQSRGAKGRYQQTLEELDHFLVSLGYLEATRTTDR